MVKNLTSMCETSKPLKKKPSTYNPKSNIENKTKCADRNEFAPLYDFIELPPERNDIASILFSSNSKIVRLQVFFSNSLVFNTSCHKFSEVNNLCAVESKLPTGTRVPDLSGPVVYSILKL